MSKIAYPDECAIPPIAEEQEWMKLCSDKHATQAKGPRIEFPQEFPDIPVDSPLYKFKDFRKNWDGEGAEPLSLLLLHRGERFWRAIKALPTPVALPQVTPGRDNFIAFTWTEAKNKRLDIWIHGESVYKATYDLEFAGESEPVEEVETNLRELIDIVNKYSEK